MRYLFFFSLLFSRKMVFGCRAVLLGSLQAQTVFILASLQVCFWSGRYKSRRAGRRLVGTAGLLSERSWPRGGRSPSRLCWGETSSNRRLAAKEEAATWVRRAHRRDTKAHVVAARKDGGLELARVSASMRMKLDALLLHLPRASMRRTTKRRRCRLGRHSGYAIRMSHRC